MQNVRKETNAFLNSETFPDFERSNGNSPESPRWSSDNSFGEAATDTLTGIPNSSELLEKIQTSNERLRIEGEKCIFKMTSQGGFIPVAFDSNPNLGIAAIQKFDPNSPKNIAVINAAVETIEDGIARNIFENNQFDANFVQFCIYAANEAIRAKRPEQDNNANSQLVDKAVQTQGGVIEQQDVEAKNAHVCKDFAPLLLSILNKYNITAYGVASKQEEHMFGLVEIPGEGTTRVDAKKDPECVLDNELIDYYYATTKE